MDPPEARLRRLPPGPPDVLDKLFAAATKAVNDPEVKAKLPLGGNEAQRSKSPAAFGEWAHASGRTQLERVMQAGVNVD